MSSNEKVYAGDLGTRVVLDCGQNVSAATGRSIEVQKPDGSTASWSASASGTNSILFDTVSGSSFSLPGTWRLQSRIVIGSGVWRGKTVTLTVYPPFR